MARLTTEEELQALITQVENLREVVHSMLDLLPPSPDEEKK